VEGMRLAGIHTIEAANRFLEIRFFRVGAAFTWYHVIPAMRIDGWARNSSGRNPKRGPRAQVADDHSP